MIIVTIAESSASSPSSAMNVRSIFSASTGSRLGEPQEAPRVDESTLGMIPADEGLDSENLAAAQVELWLIEDPELVRVNRVAKRGLHLEPLVYADSHVVVEQLVGISPLLGS